MIHATIPYIAMNFGGRLAVSAVVAAALGACTLAGTEGLTGGGGSPDGGGGADGSPGTTSSPDAGLATDGSQTTSGGPGSDGSIVSAGAPKFVNATTADGSGSKVTIETPAETQTGDFLMATVYSEKDTNVVTPPPGWTTRKNLPNCYSDMYWAYSFATAPGATAVTFEFSITIGGRAAISAYRGVSQNLPFDADLGATYFSKSYAVPSLTTTMAPDLLLVLAINDEGVGQSWSWSGTSNLAKRLDNGTIGIFDVPLAAAGSTPTGQVTATGDTPCGSVEIAALHP